MATELKPIRTKADYKAALAEVERLWGAKSGTPKGDRLDVLATLIDACETRHYPMDPPDPIANGLHGALRRPGLRASRRRQKRASPRPNETSN
jgi:antitoxin component HigA of HigAB toxin-antitoxin module